MVRAVAIVALLVAACIPAETAPDPVDPELVSVASEVCPIMWRWQLSVGRILNDMSAASYAEADPEARRTLYTRAFEDARRANNTLRDEVGRLSPGPYVDLLAEDIVNGLAAANTIIDEIEGEVSAAYIGTTRLTYHQMVPRIFLGFEKVIDIAKPEMSDYANEDLTNAFISVPQCQHGVKDANDGIPRYVPLD